MIYTELTRKAMKIMFEAHKEQLDKAGIPYVFHPWHVAEAMTDELTTAAALLHDVVEDTAVDEEALLKQGIPEEVLKVLRLLTHSKEVSYKDYIEHLAISSAARKVKLSDLKHNSDTSRLPGIDEKTAQRLRKYDCARRYLEHIEALFGDRDVLPCKLPGTDGYF